MDTLLIEIFLGFVTLLFSIIAFFFVRIVNQLDKVTENATENAEKIAGLAESIVYLKRDIQTALITAQAVNELEKTVTILERNEKTIFAKIDDLHKKLNLLSKSYVRYKEDL